MMMRFKLNEYLDHAALQKKQSLPRSKNIQLVRKQLKDIFDMKPVKTRK